MILRWKAAGWLCAGLSVVFAALSLALALRGDAVFVPYPGIRIGIPPNLAVPQAGLLRAIVFGVLAGVAFFTALACFFWSAVVEARQQRTEIIRLLAEAARPGRDTETGA